MIRKGRVRPRAGDFRWGRHILSLSVFHSLYQVTKIKIRRLSLPSPYRFFALLFTAQLLYYLGFYLFRAGANMDPLGVIFSLHFRHPT